MPTFELTSPEGKKYQIDAPEGATQEQALSYFQQEFANQQPEQPTPQGAKDLGRTAAVMQGFNAAVPFGNRITAGLAAGGAALLSGDSDVSSLYNDARANQKATSQVHPGYETAGTIGGIANSLPLLLSKGAGNLGSISKGLNAAKTTAGNFVRGGASTGGNIARGAALAAGSSGLYGYGASENDLDTKAAFDDAAKSAALGAGLGLAVPAVAGAVGKLNTKVVRPTAQQLKLASTNNYLKAEKLGGQLKSTANDDFINFAQGFGTKDEMAAAFAGDSPLAPIAKELEKYKGQPLTLSRATSVDQAITDRLDDKAFHDNGVLNVYGRQLLDIKNKLRSTLTEAADNGLVEGGREGIDAYKTAVKDWAAQSQINEIQRIVDRASFMDNPATALKTGFRNIATNPGRLNKYPKEVQKAIKNAARDGDISNILRSQIGSRLISGAVGAATGSAAGPIGTIAGAVAGGATGGLARKAAESMQMNRVNKVVDAIAANSSLPTTSAKRITAQDLQKAFEAKKGIKP